MSRPFSFLFSTPSISFRTSSVSGTRSLELLPLKSRADLYAFFCFLDEQGKDVQISLNDLRVWEDFVASVEFAGVGFISLVSRYVGWRG